MQTDFCKYQLESLELANWGSNPKGVSQGKKYTRRSVHHTERHKISPFLSFLSCFSLWRVRTVPVKSFDALLPEKLKERRKKRSQKQKLGREESVSRVRIQNNLAEQTFITKNK